MLGAEVMLIAGIGLLLAIMIPMLSAVWATLSSFIAFAAVSGLSILAWTQAHTVLPLATSLLMILSLYVMNMAYGYFVESRSKRQFTELFGQYVPPELVDRMAQDPEKYSMEGKEETLTVLFSDGRGFTSISESLSAKDLTLYINDYLTAMSLVIRGNGGVTLLSMQKRAAELNEEFRAKGWPEFKIGIGVNSGRMRVGDMGSKLRK